jgi:pimeloyl-ACP methyl ester carboxylesterase
MAGITQRETHEVEAANRSGRQPVAFIHGLWLLPSSWARWRALFEEAGFSTIAPAWPDDPTTVVEANARPEVFANKSIGEVADHLDAVVRGLETRPAIIGHSFGGLMAQILAGRGLSAASVAIDPAPFRSVLPLPFSALRAASPVLLNPRNRGRAVALTREQFRYAFANAVSAQEAAELHGTFAVPGAGKPVFQAALANINPRTEAKVDTRNPERGPLLILDGEKDNTVPWSLANAAYARQRRNPGVTEIALVPGRGHSLVIDSGWRDVADLALAFVQRFVPPGTTSARGATPPSAG